MIPNFCIDRPFWVSTYQDFFFVSNFCLDCPFGFSVHRDAHFSISHLFRFATYRAFIFDKVFFDCTDIHGTCEFVTILCNQASVCPWSLVVKIVHFWAQSLLLEIHGDEPSCWKFVSISFDIVVQGRHVF